MKLIDIIACILVVVGGLNWGLVGAFDLDLVSTLFGAGSVISRVLYILIGLSAAYQIFRWKCGEGRCCK